MIIPVTIDGQQMLAIALEGPLDGSFLPELRKSLVEVLTSCISSDETKDVTSSTSLWFLIQLIEAITPDSQEGGTATRHLTTSLQQQQ